MPVADTSFLIDLMRRDHGAMKRYEEYEGKSAGLATTVITAMELYKGAYISKNRGNVEKVRTLLELFAVLPVDDAVYEVFGRLAAGLYLAGTPAGDFDEVIAAITLCSDGGLITRDRHFELIPGLKVIGY